MALPWTPRAYRSPVARDLADLAALAAPRCPHRDDGAPWIDGTATSRQAEFLVLDRYGVTEALYGGAAGGGKSWALLAAAAQYVDVPGYSALLLRRRYTDLAKPGALMDRAHTWWTASPASWSADQHVWTFPSGARISFGYIEGPRDLEQYQSAEYQFIGFDELTQFSEAEYRFLFSRLRRPATSPVPIRMRTASNPGGRGHEWVRARFIDPATRQPGAHFVPATLDDNPHLDRAEYTRSLDHLDPVTRARLLDGDWDVRPPGAVFRREWFRPIRPDAAPDRVAVRVRAWDLAGSESATAANTVGVRISRLHSPTPDGVRYLIEHAARIHASPGRRDAAILAHAHADPHGTIQWIEQEPGSGGIAQAAAIRAAMPRLKSESGPATGDKLARAGPFASAAERGEVGIVIGPWNHHFLDVLEGFPEAKLKDEADAAAHAYNRLVGARGMTGALPVPDDHRKTLRDEFRNVTLR